MHQPADQEPQQPEPNGPFFKARFPPRQRLEERLSEERLERDWQRVVAGELPCVDLKLLFSGIGGCASHCRLRLFAEAADKTRTVVVMTEAHDNEGTSITNWAEHLATRVLRVCRLDAEQVTWIEHYPDRRERFRNGQPDLTDTSGEESFDLVSFNILISNIRLGSPRGGGAVTLGNPQWRPLVREIVERLTGRVWEPEAYPF